jgi:hypothetical protein
VLCAAVHGITYVNCTLLIELDYWAITPWNLRVSLSRSIIQTRHGQFGSYSARVERANGRMHAHTRRTHGSCILCGVRRHNNCHRQRYDSAHLAHTIPFSRVWAHHRRTHKFGGSCVAVHGTQRTHCRQCRCRQYSARTWRKDRRSVMCADRMW